VNPLRDESGDNGHWRLLGHAGSFSVKERSINLPL